MDEHAGVGRPPGAIAIAAALTLAGPPASAASDERADKVGDAPRIIDIASFSVRNDNSRAVITSHVPGLKTRGGFASGTATASTAA